MSQDDAFSSYKSPLSSRYSSDYMKYLYSDRYKFQTWRKLWTILAKAQHDLGLSTVTLESVNLLKENINNIDFEQAKKEEKKLRHDVMAHVHTFKSCVEKVEKGNNSEAGGIIHLGATSCFVGDNTELIIHQKALRSLTDNLANVIHKLSIFADSYKKLPCLGFTHIQPAQLTTVGKRATLWLQDFVIDFQELLHIQNTHLKFRSIKGATGTQATFLELFNNDHEKVDKLSKLVTKYAGFEKAGTFITTGQTYPRKLDVLILNCLANLAQSSYKMCQDIRLLASMKELEEPFESSQIGSSAMPYKRNPMRSERVNALARHLMTLNSGMNQTAATQMFERTLDDSAYRRIALAEGALTADAILKILNNICAGLVVYPKVITKHVNNELPFMVSENIMMHLVKNHNQNRQDVHEKLRVHSQKAGNQVKIEGGDNDLIERLLSDDYFAQFIDKKFIDEKIMNPSDYIGRSVELTDEFLQSEVRPLLQKYAADRKNPESSYLDELVDEPLEPIFDLEKIEQLNI